MHAILFDGVVICFVTAGIVGVVKALFFQKLSSRPIEPQDDMNTVTYVGETEVTVALAANFIERWFRNRK